MVYRCSIGKFTHTHTFCSKICLKNTVFYKVFFYRFLKDISILKALKSPEIKVLFSFLQIFIYLILLLIFFSPLNPLTSPALKHTLGNAVVLEFTELVNMHFHELERVDVISVPSLFPCTSEQVNRRFALLIIN